MCKNILTKNNGLIKHLVVNLIVAIIAAACGHFFTIQEINYEHQLNMNSLSIEEMLEKAENYYKFNDYLKVIDIYKNKKLEDNPVALYNLAYFYARGIGIEQDIDKAKELYQRSYLVSEEYIGGYVAINILNPESIGNVMNLITEGIKNNDEYTIRYIKAVLYAQYPDETYDEKTYLEQNDEWRYQLLKKDLVGHYEWRKERIADTDFSRYLKDWERKEQIGTYEKKTETGSMICPIYGTVIYKLYEFKEFKNSSCVQNNIRFIIRDE